MVSRTEVDIITGYFWDKGIKGGTQKRLMENFMKSVSSPATAIARRDKIDVC